MFVQVAERSANTLTRPSVAFLGLKTRCYAVEFDEVVGGLFRLSLIYFKQCATVGNY